jgi:hypothetical protein
MDPIYGPTRRGEPNMDAILDANMDPIYRPTRWGEPNMDPIWTHICWVHIGLSPTCGSIYVGPIMDPILNPYWVHIGLSPTCGSTHWVQYWVHIGLSPTCGWNAGGGSAGSVHPHVGKNPHVSSHRRVGDVAVQCFPVAVHPCGTLNGTLFYLY